MLTGKPVFRQPVSRDVTTGAIGDAILAGIRCNFLITRERRGVPLFFHPVFNGSCLVSESRADTKPEDNSGFSFCASLPPHSCAHNDSGDLPSPPRKLMLFSPVTGPTPGRSSMKICAASCGMEERSASLLKRRMTVGPPGWKETEARLPVAAPDVKLLSVAASCRSVPLWPENIASGVPLAE